MSLGTRIALLVGAAVLLATAITGTGLAVSSRSIGRDVIDRELRAASAAFVGPNEQQPNPALVRDVFESRTARCDRTEALSPQAEDQGDRDDGRAGRNPGGRQSRFLPPQLRSGLQLIEPNGATTASCLSPFEPSAAELEIAASGVGRTLRSVSIGDDRYRVLTVGQGSLGAVQFAEDLQVIESAMQGLLTRIVAFGLIGAALAAAIGWFWAKRATKPVRELSATAEHVALTNDLGERISITGNDEISALAASFNHMLVSLDTSRTQQRRLVQDASHELRTPLTSIRTNIELLRRHPTIDQHTQDTILSDILVELAELSDLSAELVDSATELDTSPGTRVETDFESLVESCVARGRRRHTRSIELIVTSPALVQVDPGALSRAIDNLVGNAAKFTPISGQIAVTVTGGSVTVTDTGPGIPDSDLPYIFDRFYRATTARTEPGSGLGLSIVKQIVQAHDGSVFASNRPTGGAAIGFTLPTI